MPVFGFEKSDFKNVILPAGIGITLLLGIVLEYNEGHFISWLTIPIIAVISLYCSKNITRACIATFSMGFLHEGLWYWLGNITVNFLIPHGYQSALINLTSSTKIYSSFVLLPFAFGLAYVFLYKPKHFLPFLVVFAAYMIIWDFFGFPISTLITTNPYMYLAPYFEIGSWLLIFSLFAYYETRKRKVLQFYVKIRGKVHGINI